MTKRGALLCTIAMATSALRSDPEGATRGVFANKFGAVIQRHFNYLRDAIVENVELYPQSDAITADKNIVRRGLLIRYPKAEATIIICHGFMCDKFDAGFLRQLFPTHTYNFLTFDFRAHGEETGGQYCTFGRDEAFDVIAAAKFIEHHPDLRGKKRFVYGFSMGAVSAIEAESYVARHSNGIDRLFDALVLDCPFDSSQNVVQRNLDGVTFSFFGCRFRVPGLWLLQRYLFNPLVQSLVKGILKTFARLDPKDINMYIYPVFPADSAKDLRAPVLFIHCKNDDKVSVDAVKAVFANTSSRHKELWITNGRCHFDSYFYNPEQYGDRVRLFFDQARQGLLDTSSYIDISYDLLDVAHNT